MSKMLMRRLVFVFLLLATIVFVLGIDMCDDGGKSEIEKQADILIEELDDFAAEVNKVIEEANAAKKKAEGDIEKAEKDIKKAKEAEDEAAEQKIKEAEEAKVAAIKRSKAAGMATKKAELAKKKVEKAKEKAEEAKKNKSKKELDEAKKKLDEAKEMLDKAKGVLKGLNEIPKARQTLKDLGFSDQEIKEILEELDAIAEGSETGQPPDIFYRRRAGKKLQDKGVDLSTEEGKKKLKDAIKAFEDLFHGEGTMGEGHVE